MNERRDIIPLDARSRVFSDIQANPVSYGNQLVSSFDIVALRQATSNTNVNEGTFHNAIIGPVSQSQHIEANKIEHATIIHHHHQANNSREAPMQQVKSKDNVPEGYVKLFEDTFVYNAEPIQAGKSVYRGYQLHVTGQKQQIAIKMIAPCDGRSIREVQHLVNLCEKSPHPNVTRIVRSKVHQGLTQKELYIVMEMCNDYNLRDYLDDNSRLMDLNQAVLFACQLISAMEHIHKHDIIHGDLKPENILFSLDGRQIKVSDFGISKQLRESKSCTMFTGQGTDGYRAPETYSSAVISKSADIYSLAINLYLLFARGEHPFGDDPDLWKHHIKKNKHCDLSSLTDEMGILKEPFIKLLHQIFQSNPEKRPKIEDVMQHEFTRKLFQQREIVISTPLRLTCPAGSADNLMAKELKAYPVAGVNDEKPRSKPSSGFTHAEVSHGHPVSFASGESYPRSDADPYSSGEKSFPGADANPALSSTAAESVVKLADNLQTQRITDPRPSQISLGSLGLSLDLSRLKWCVTGPSCPEDIKVTQVDSGWRICCVPQQTSVKCNSLPTKVNINGVEMSYDKFPVVCVPVPWSIVLWPGIVMCPDQDNTRLFAVNLCHKSLNLKFCNEYEPEAKFSSLPRGNSALIFSTNKFSRCIEAKKKQNEQLVDLPAVVFSISLSISNHVIFRMTPTL